MVVTEMIMIVHWGLTPFTFAAWCSGYVSSFFFSFIWSFVLWSLYAMAAELDNPFGQDVNDLNIWEEQRRFNLRLSTLLHHCMAPAPKLGPTANMCPWLGKCLANS